MALEQRADLGRVLAAQHGRAGDLGAVEVQDRQHGAVARGVEEGDALPRALQRPGLGLAVADHRQRDQVGVVHHRPEGVHQHVAELPALVDRARRRHGHVAGDAAGCGELAEEPPHPLGVAGDVRVGLGVGPLEVAGGDERGAPVAGTGEVEHLLPGLADQPRRVRVDERQPRAGPPVAEQPRLDVLGGQRLPQQRVGHQVDLADGQVVVGPPPGVEGGHLGIVEHGEPCGHLVQQSTVRHLVRPRLGGPRGGATGTANVPIRRLESDGSWVLRRADPRTPPIARPPLHIHTPRGYGGRHEHPPHPPPHGHVRGRRRGAGRGRGGVHVPHAPGDPSAGTGVVPDLRHGPGAGRRHR